MALRRRHAETGIAHLQRVEDALLQERLERHPAHHLHQPRQHFQPGAVVTEARARIGGQRGAAESLHEIAKIGGRLRIAARGQHRGGIVAGQAGREAGGVGQQLANGDRAGRRSQRGRFRRAGGHLHRGELGQVARHRIVQTDPAFFQQDQHGHRGNRLGHRIDAKDRILLHGRMPRQVAMAIGAVIHHLAIAHHQRHRSQVTARSNGLLHETMQTLQARCGKAVQGRPGPRQRLCRRHIRMDNRHEEGDGAEQSRCKPEHGTPRTAKTGWPAEPTGHPHDCRGHLPGWRPVRT